MTIAHWRVPRLWPRWQTWRRLAWFRVAVLAAGAALAAFLVFAFLAARLTPAQITDEVSRRLGLEVAASDVHLAWTGLISLRNLRVRDQGTEILQSPLASVRLSFWRLLSGQVAMADLRLESPTFTIEKERVRPLLSHLAARDPASGLTVPIRIRHGQVVLRDARGTQLVLPDLSGRFQVSASGVDLDCVLSDGHGARCSLTGRVAPEQVSLKSTIRDLALLPLTSQEGTVNGTVDLDASPGTVDLKGSLDIHSGLGSATFTLAARPPAPVAAHTGSPSSVPGASPPWTVVADTRAFTLGEDLVRRGLRGTGAISIALTPDLRTAQALVAFPDLRLHDRALGPFQARLSFDGPRVTVDQVAAPLLARTVSVTGGVNLRAQSLNLRCSVADVDLARIANLAGSGSQASAFRGTARGIAVARGPFRAPEVRFAGTLSRLALAEHPLGDVKVAALATRQEARLTAYRLQLGRLAPWISPLPPLHGAATISIAVRPDADPHVSFQADPVTMGGRRLPPIRGAATWHSPIATITDLAAGRSHGQGTVDTSTRRVHLTCTLADQSLDSLPLPTPRAMPAMHGRLSGRLELSCAPGSLDATFSGPVRGARLAFSTLGSGHLECHVSQGGASRALTVSARGTGFSAGQVGMLAGRFPGISGNVAFALATSGGTSSVDAWLSGARRGGGFFPDLRLHGTMAGSRLSVRPLAAPSLGLALYGYLDMARRAISLQGTLRGQSIASLMVLAGSGAPGIRANLSGPLSVVGSLGSPTMHFNGAITGLLYKGMRLGSGRLSLAATLSWLNARLMLDRPMPVSVPVALGRLNLPPMARMALAEVKPKIGVTVSVIGATIRGSPQHPVVTPIVTGVPRLATTAIKLQGLRRLPIRVPNVPGLPRKVTPTDILRKVLRPPGL